MLGIFKSLPERADLGADMNEQLVINLIASRKELKKYPGLKVGSTTEPSTDGNWE
jgi:hypothetical protein